MANPGGAAALVLGKQLKRMQGEDYIEGISVGLVDDNVFEWEVMLMINDDCKFYGGTQIGRWRGSERRDTTAERCRPLTFFLLLRRFLSSPVELSQGLPTLAAQDEVRDADMASQQYVTRVVRSCVKGEISYPVG
jgi:hypothetical protein